MSASASVLMSGWSTRLSIHLGSPGTTRSLESRETARRLLELYQRGEHDAALERRAADDLAVRRMTAKGRPRLAGRTTDNPPISFFDTEVYSETQRTPSLPPFGDRHGPG
jgi:hypothetical protein